MLALRNRERYPLAGLRDEMDRLFGEFFGELPSTRTWEPFGMRTYPSVSTWEDQENFYVEAELPGLKSDDLNVSVVGNEVTIKGERREPQKPEEVGYQRRERGFGAFNRVLRLPTDVDEDHVEATLRDGVLTITLPKAAAPRARKINVEAAAD